MKNLQFIAEAAARIGGYYASRYLEKLGPHLRDTRIETNDAIHRLEKWRKEARQIGEGLSGKSLSTVEEYDYHRRAFRLMSEQIVKLNDDGLLKHIDGCKEDHVETGDCPLCMLLEVRYRVLRDDSIDDLIQKDAGTGI